MLDLWGEDPYAYIIGSRSRVVWRARKLGVDDIPVVDRVRFVGALLRIESAGATVTAPEDAEIVRRERLIALRAQIANDPRAAIEIAAMHEALAILAVDAVADRRVVDGDPGELDAADKRMTGLKWVPVRLCAARDAEVRPDAAGVLHDAYGAVVDASVGPVIYAGRYAGDWPAVATAAQWRGLAGLDASFPGGPG